MSSPNASHPRSVSNAPSACPGPPLVADVITMPESGQIGRLNPVSARHGFVYRDREGGCFVNGPLPPGVILPSGSSLNTMAVPCPAGMFEGCFRGHLLRLDDQSCVCTEVEGDPPDERQRPVACPPAR